MKKLSTLFVIILLTFLSTQSCGQKPHEESLVLKKAEFSQRLNAESEPQLIDVRTKEEYDQGAIDGAVNYNFLDGTFEKSLEKLDKNKTVFVYCAVGGRSGKASKLLKEKGFVSVIDLKGGYNAWSK